jgi:hypothetical protein
MIKIIENLEQGSDEWIAARCGILTASEMKHIITPSQLKAANNDKMRSHLYELLAQRINKYVEPQYISDDMLRGLSDEVDAKILYGKNYAETHDVGFITNDKWGFTLGYSPDALVGKDGQIECKSRRQKFQVETILDGVLPLDYLIQIQTGLLVSERSWCDFISYSAGMPMMVLRVYPDADIHAAIVSAAEAFESRLVELRAKYDATISAPGARFIPTERKPPEQEITV